MGKTENKLENGDGSDASSCSVGFKRGDLLTEVETGITHAVICAPFGVTDEYTVRSYGGESDDTFIEMDRALVESGRFVMEPNVKEQPPAITRGVKKK